MIRYLLLLVLALPVFAQTQYAPNVPMQKGNVTVTLREFTSTDCHQCFIVALDTTDEAVNAFKVTIKLDYLGYPMARTFVVPRNPIPAIIAPIITWRSVTGIAWGQIPWVRGIIVEEQKTSASVEF